jgi:hypothetical protein
MTQDACAGNARPALSFMGIPKRRGDMRLCESPKCQFLALKGSPFCLEHMRMSQSGLFHAPSDARICTSCALPRYAEFEGQNVCKCKHNGRESPMSRNTKQWLRYGEFLAAVTLAMIVADIVFGATRGECLGVGLIVAYIWDNYACGSNR